MNNLLLLLIIPFLCVGQLFTIDNDEMELYNIASISNFSENTYVNTLDDINMSYQIITDSMPATWDFQHCFPECHPINTYFIDPIAFSADSSVFLKGHFYPNNTPGEGLMVMELEANHGAYLDTVTWRGIAMEETNLKEHINKSNQIKYITNLAGQKINHNEAEGVMIVTYKNNQSTIYYILK